MKLKLAWHSSSPSWHHTHSNHSLQSYVLELQAHHAEPRMTFLFTWKKQVGGQGGEWGCPLVLSPNPALEQQQV